MDAEHNSAQLYNTPRHPCVAHGKWRGAPCPPPRTRTQGSPNQWPRGPHTAAVVPTTPRTHPRPPSHGTTQTRDGEPEHRAPVPRDNLSPHGDKATSHQAVLTQGRKLAFTLASALRGGLSLKGGLRDSPRSRGRDRGADSL